MELSWNTLQSPQDFPKRTVMGPLLFLLHINDMLSVVDPGTSVHLFADDTLIYRVGRLKSREWTSWHGQKCRGGHRGSGH